MNSEKRDPTKDIRRATSGDAEGLQACMKAAYDAYQERLGAQRLPSMDVDYALEIRDNPTWVIMSSDKVVGGIIMAVDHETASIANVAVHPDHQGEGIGGALMRHAESVALNRSCTSLAPYGTNRLLRASRRWTMSQDLGWVAGPWVRGVTTFGRPCP